MQAFWISLEQDKQIIKFFQIVNKYLYLLMTNLNKMYMGIVSLSIPKNLLEKVDSYIQEQGFANRSEIIRQALRVYMS